MCLASSGAALELVETAIMWDTTGGSSLSATFQLPPLTNVQLQLLALGQEIAGYLGDGTWFGKERDLRRVMPKIPPFEAAIFSKRIYLGHLKIICHSGKPSIAPWRWAILPISLRGLEIRMGIMACDLGLDGSKYRTTICCTWKPSSDDVLQMKVFLHHCLPLNLKASIWTLKPVLLISAIGRQLGLGYYILSIVWSCYSIPH